MYEAPPRGRESKPPFRMAEHDWYRKMESRSWSTLWQRGGVVEVGLASPKGNYVRTLGKTTPYPADNFFVAATSDRAIHKT